MQLINAQDGWDSALLSLPNAHLLQSWAWGELKQRYGWTPQRYVWRSNDGTPVAAAQVLRRKLPIMGKLFGTAMLYVPKGPVFDWADADLRTRVLNDLQGLAKTTKAVFLKIDPDVLLGAGLPQSADEQLSQVGSDWESDLSQRGWQYSIDQVQFRNTAIIDLTADDDSLMAGFHQKTRYNIRLAAKKGVTVHVGDLKDFPALMAMYRETANRNGFIIRADEYYFDVWQTLMQAGACAVLVAEVEGTPVAGLVLTHFGGRAIYMYGMSGEAHRNLMPTYALQWAAMQHAKQHLNCHTYDFWGAPEVFDESDSLWGVWRFKAGFNGIVQRTLGAWDYPTQRWGYRLYSQVRPQMLRLRSKAKAASTNGN